MKLENHFKRKRTNEDNSDSNSPTSEDKTEDDYELLIKEVQRLRERNIEQGQLLKEREKQLVKQNALLEQKDQEIHNLKSTARVQAKMNRRRVNGLEYLRDLKRF